MKKEVRFEIPEVGSFTIDVNEFKYLTPFSHYNKEEKEKDKKKREKLKEYIVWHNGCGISGVNKIKDGYDVIKNYSEQYLSVKKAELEVDLEKIQKVIETTKEFDWIQLFRKE